MDDGAGTHWSPRALLPTHVASTQLQAVDPCVVGPHNHQIAGHCRGGADGHARPTRPDQLSPGSIDSINVVVFGTKDQHIARNRWASDDASARTKFPAHTAIHRAHRVQMMIVGPDDK